MEKEINIFKKIGYSLGKPQKYEQMGKEGLKKAIQYMATLIILFSFIISGITVGEIHENYETQINYIKENLPEVTYKEGKLDFETEKEIILADETVENIIGGTVIIDTNNYNEEQKSKYTNQILEEGDYGIILFAENMIMISNAEELKTVEYKYTELFKENFGEDIEFNKQDVIQYLENVPYINYFVTYTVTYFVSMTIIMVVNILVMSLVGLLYQKVMKLNIKYKNVLSMSIYASTIAILLNIIYYTILGIFNIAIPYIDMIYISVPYIYLIIALFTVKQSQNSK